MTSMNLFNCTLIFWSHRVVVNTRLWTFASKSSSDSMTFYVARTLAAAGYLGLSLIVSARTERRGLIQHDGEISNWILLIHYANCRPFHLRWPNSLNSHQSVWLSALECLTWASLALLRSRCGLRGIKLAVQWAQHRKQKTINFNSRASKRALGSYKLPNKSWGFSGRNASMFRSVGCLGCNCICRLVLSLCGWSIKVVFSAGVAIAATPWWSVRPITLIPGIPPSWPIEEIFDKYWLMFEVSI